MRVASRAWQRYRRTAAAHSKTLEVCEIRIGGEADAALFSVTGLEGEGRVARDLIAELIELQVRRRELLSIKRRDDDVAEAFQNLSAGVVEAAIGAHRTIRRAGLGIELHACVSKIELCLIVVDEHRVCLELAALHAIGSEQRAHAKSDLLRGVDGSRRTDRRLLVLLARDGAGDAADRDDEQTDAPNAHDRAHPTRARMRSCKCTTPTNSAPSLTTGIAMIPCCSIR